MVEKCSEIENMNVLTNTLKDKLLFPLPKGDDLRDDAPMIDSNHPIYDYYNDVNWKGSASSSAPINKILIMPSSIPDSMMYAGLYTVRDYTSAINKIAGANNSTFTKDMSWKEMNTALTDFVRSVCEEHCKETILTEFIYNSGMEPKSYRRTFMCNKDTDYCDYVYDDRDTVGHDQMKSDAYTMLASLYKSKVADGGTSNGSLGDHKETTNALFDGMRLFWAFKMIDEVFGDHSEDFFFIERLVKITKVLFVAQMLTSVGSEVHQLMFDNLMLWCYTDVMKYATVSAETDGALDDMFRDNVKTSKEIKDNSLNLQNTKHTVVKAQDNLQSLSSSDSMVKRQRRNSFFLYWTMMVLLVLQVLSLIGAAMSGQRLTAYVIIISISMVALGLEMSRTLRSLINF
ncbi:hypothetical protein TetV_412 [Tetraselmis virus 1]|uniref:Uncharacterized protein n=1 Tax=Tetraselmis virus 1 TaxID=2060617 RepID=A0A2P0VNM0_9VIRU|nr:hypothetical protein QJ968_gp642 [Tetraselmis virus 1]AUF82494.1 hypothetical protein TetV_412 [Tetraselmis virus 1]